MPGLKVAARASSPVRFAVRFMCSSFHIVGSMSTWDQDAVRRTFRPRVNRLRRGERPGRWRLFRYRIDTIGVEGDPILDLGDGRKGSLIGPHGVDRFLSTRRDAVVAAVSLV